MKRPEVQELIDMAYALGTLIGHRTASERLFAAELDTAERLGRLDEFDRRLLEEAGLDLRADDDAARELAQKMDARGWLPRGVTPKGD
ncbi:hypothetical protein E5344_12250 [Microbacterium laevaniformans]|uniref:Uncharacterized protein n=1 Tax=Microbacterium laevaniformans TaxID=36807 RepID=A0A4V3RJ92_9MICO|nr:hypothetical protein [Microbacterium laevaniformans]TGY35050.1 hypothetical protein E5344_12250 [Microbacterium laevaniformans]